MATTDRLQFPERKNTSDGIKSIMNDSDQVPTFLDVNKKEVLPTFLHSGAINLNDLKHLGSSQNSQQSMLTTHQDTSRATSVRLTTTGCSSLTPSTPLTGYGYDLPLSKLYVRYLHGDLVITSYEGFGTDIMVYLKMPWLFLFVSDMFIFSHFQLQCLFNGQCLFIHIFTEITKHASNYSRTPYFTFRIWLK